MVIELVNSYDLIFQVEKKFMILYIGDDVINTKDMQVEDLYIALSRHICSEQLFMTGTAVCCYAYLNVWIKLYPMKANFEVLEGKPNEGKEGPDKDGTYEAHYEILTPKDSIWGAEYEWKMPDKEEMRITLNKRKSSMEEVADYLKRYDSAQDTFLKDFEKRLERMTWARTGDAW